MSAADAAGENINSVFDGSCAMAPHLSEDTKRRIVEAVEAGKPPKDVASFFGVSLATVYDLKKKDRDREEGVGRKAGSGGSNRKRTAEFLAELDEDIQKDPKTSMRRLAKDRGVAPGTIRRAVKELGYTSYAQPVAHLVTDQQKVTRVERCRGLINQLKRGPGVVFFTDEKVFVQDAHVNRRNSRILARSPDERDDHVMFRTKHPVSVMVFGLVASDGKKMPLIQFQPRFRLNMEGYLDVLRQVKAWILEQYPDARGDDGDLNPNFKFVFQQDGAPAHTARGAQSWLEENFGAKRYWNKEQ